MFNEMSDYCCFSDNEFFTGKIISYSEVEIDSNSSLLDDQNDVIITDLVI